MICHPSYSKTQTKITNKKQEKSHFLTLGNGISRASMYEILTHRALKNQNGSSNKEYHVIKEHNLVTKTFRVQVAWGRIGSKLQTQVQYEGNNGSNADRKLNETVQEKKSKGYVDMIADVPEEFNSTASQTTKNSPQQNQTTNNLQLILVTKDPTNHLNDPTVEMQEWFPGARLKMEIFNNGNRCVIQDEAQLYPPLPVHEKTTLHIKYQVEAMLIGQHIIILDVLYPRISNHLTERLEDLENQVDLMCAKTTRINKQQYIEVLRERKAIGVFFRNKDKIEAYEFSY
jgi:predicted DNA-binding WGR domain protein